MEIVALKMKNRVCGLLYLLSILPILAYAQESQHIYSTGEVFELDRVVSAWLIKRYVAPNAVFRFFPEGELITDGIAFDTPDAALQRTHNMSTFEVIKNRYKITDPRLAELTRIVHNAEINFWAGERKHKESELVQKINRLIKSTNNNYNCLEQCFVIFDQFIER